MIIKSISEFEEKLGAEYFVLVELIRPEKIGLERERNSSALETQRR